MAQLQGQGFPFSKKHTLWTWTGLCLVLALISGHCTVSASPFSVLIPPQGVLSIYARSTRDFESAIFPVYVTSYQPAVFVSTSSGHGHGSLSGPVKQGRARTQKIEGRLIAATNANGCSLDALPVPPFEGDWILLVDNLGCDYATKIRNSALQGFQALLVYSANSAEPPLISVDPTQLRLPAANAAAVYTSSVGATDGFLLKSLYAYPNDFFIELEENSFVFIDVLYHLMLICFTITSLFVGLLCASWIYDTCKCQRCIERLEEERKQKLLQAFLAKKTIVRQWSADGPFQNNDSCIICLEEFGTADQIRVLPCLHVFHISCIDHWMLRVSMCCPICKQYIGTKVEEQQVLQNQAQPQPHEYEYDYHDAEVHEGHDYNHGESIPLLPLWGPSSASASAAAANSGCPRSNSNSSPSSSSAMDSLRSTSQSVCALLPLPSEALEGTASATSIE